MKYIFSVILLAGTCLSSCRYVTGKRINGDGHVISQARSFSGFTSVDVASAIDVYIKQDAAFSVKVETDENLQQYITITEENGTLKIKQQDNTNLDATGKIKVFISAPSFKKLEASGACHITSESVVTAPDEITIELTGASSADLELKAPKISAEMQGASRITLRGQTKDLFIEGSGASHANCFGLLSENADVDVAGASSAEVFASVSLKTDASGASHIKYKGAASHVGSTNGASSVAKVE